jgi:hypothetical protein
MSHFSTVKTQYTSKKVLVQALKNLGLDVTEHKTPVALKSRWSDQASAHLVIPGEQLNSGVDIGFLHENNAYQLVADEYELRLPSFKFPNFKQDLSVEYAILVAQRQGMRLVNRQTNNGQVQLVLQGGI